MVELHSRYTVTVVIHTFNQDKSINKCLTGVISQTYFPFIRVLVIDDCSSDLTNEISLEIAKKYPDQITVITNDTNQYQKGGLIGIEEYYKINTKYIAWCDGDDYWCDPNKIEKQVKILEADSNIGIVHTNYVLTYPNQDPHTIVPRSLRESLRARKVTSGQDLVFGNDIKHSTSVILMAEIDLDFLTKSTGIFAGDWLINISASTTKSIHYVEDVTTVVGVSQKGIWNGQDRKANDLQKDLIRWYSAAQLPDSKLRETFRNYLLKQHLKKRLRSTYPYRLVRPAVLMFRKFFAYLRSIRERFSAAT